MKKVILNFRSTFALSHDLLVAAFSWYAAFLLRFNFEIPLDHYLLMISSLLVVLLTQATSFISFGLYRGTWRFASLMDLRRILFAVLSSLLILFAIFFIFFVSPRIPRSILILDPILLILMMGGSRLIYRAFKEHQTYRSFLNKGEPVVILGAENNLVMLIKDLLQSSKWRVVGILDNDDAMHGREILGVKVYGGFDMLAKIVDRYSVHQIIIAMPSANHKDRRKALDAAKSLNLNALTVPAIDDLISGRIKISQIRPVDVEDLLGRDVVDLDHAGIQDLITGNAVMVSGAGGSIGSELCRQILKFNPSVLICFDMSELSLYQLEQVLNSQQFSVRLLFLVGDVKNKKRLKVLLDHYRPSVVFHAAAYKHVPLMEIENVSEALLNNALGTYTLAKACKAAHVSKFILISTDKAVNPTNVMGASKRLAEILCQSLQSPSGTKFMIVRFGNVLGSSGSVIPKFRQQISEGGPITVTHPDMTRYFMSIPEAAQLVIQAGLMGSGGEIFVLDMGEPVKILNLARDMIKLSGLSESDIQIKFIGLRPGEKLYEELLADGEYALATSHHKVRVANAIQIDADKIADLLSWIELSPNRDENKLKKELSQWIEGYTPEFNVVEKNNF
jgi:FlaA1/EpsC-like NDP-sugar epimerase